MSDLETKEAGRSRTNTDAALEAGERLGAAAREVIAVEEARFLIVPKGHRLENITEVIQDRRGAPDRIRATPAFTEAPAFCAYLTRFAGDTTLIFSDRDRGQLIAVLDYHGPGSPSWASHRATLKLQPAPEWIAWKARHNQPMDQVQFGMWLTEHAAEVASPPAQRLRSLAMTVERLSTQKVVAMQRLDTGEYQLISENLETPGPQQKEKVPGEITLRLRRYLGQAPLAVDGILWTRTPGGKVQFTLLFPGMPRQEEDAFGAVCEGVVAATGLPVLAGIPS